MRTIGVLLFAIVFPAVIAGCQRTPENYLAGHCQQTNANDMLDKLAKAAPPISATAASLAFVAAVYFNRRSEVRIVRPVVVFVYKDDEFWYALNVGNGPALDIVVGWQLSNGLWEKKLVRIHPLGKDREFRLHWLDGDNVEVLSAAYSSFDNHRYTSDCKNDRTTVRLGDHFPSSLEIIQEWELRRPEATSVA